MKKNLYIFIDWSKLQYIWNHTVLKLLKTRMKSEMNEENAESNWSSNLIIAQRFFGFIYAQQN